MLDIMFKAVAGFALGYVGSALISTTGIVHQAGVDCPSLCPTGQTHNANCDCVPGQNVPTQQHCDTASLLVPPLVAKPNVPLECCPKNRVYFSTTFKSNVCCPVALTQGAGISYCSEDTTGPEHTPPGLGPQPSTFPSQTPATKPTPLRSGFIPPQKLAPCGTQNGAPNAYTVNSDGTVICV